MISSSKIITDTLSRSQTRASPDDLPFESSSFDAIFRTTHPEKAKLGPSGKRKTSGRVMYECLHCPPDSPWSNGKRGNAIYHAKRKHASILQTEASTVDEHDSDIITRPSKQPRMDSFFPSRPSDTTLRRVFNRQQYIESIVGLLTRRRLPFSAVKWDEMQDIILACNPAIEDLLLTSRDAAMRHITTTFDLYRPQLKAKLQASVSKIHLSTDLWTSPHRHGILAVCVRWVDNGYRLQKALLAMPECRYSHSGERQATLMAEAIEEYGIAKQIGYHTGDNATSNDTCLKHLSQMLQDKYGISFHPNQRRIRCIAHIINLSLQAFLLASSKEALRAALAAASDVTGAEMYEQFYFTLYDVSANEPTSRSEASEQQEQSFSKVWKGKAKRAARKPPDFRDDKFRGWQTIPAMRKLHNIAVWLRNSSIHSDLWEDRVSLRLGIDNDTRWNSWYKLIDNLIRRQSQIKQFLLDYDKEINDNILNSSDWDYLERTYRFLHPFASATLWAEGKNSTLSQILTIMDGLLRHYEKNKEHYSKPETFDRRILHSIEMGWFILDKYYTMTEDAPVYAAALLLDPSKRIRYIERHWPESWHENAIAGVRTIWEEYKTQPETGPAESVDEVSASQKRQPNEWDALLEELEVTEDLGDSMDDLEDFIKATPIKISGSPLQWWCHKDQRKTYPQLSRMAIDILSIAPESADPESAFSGGRRTLSWDRERMTCENLEKVECIGNWLREGHIQKTVHGGMGVITDTGFDSGGGEDSDRVISQYASLCRAGTAICDISLTTTMDVSVSSLAQSSATSSSSSVLPSDSASQFASTLSEPEASSTEHTVKRRKLRAIATWDHFRGAQGDEPRAISGNLLHYCKRCRNPSWSTHISSNARYHLKKAHHIFVREDSSSQNKRQLAIENAFARTTARQLQQVREHERNTLRSVINVDAFREAQMLLSAHRHLPLNFVTWPEYQALLTAVNPAVQEFLTDSGNTVAADLDRAYDAHQQSVKKWLEHARSLVHIAMDVWSSPQRKAYVAVHAQWVDEAYKPRKALLGLPNLRRSHAGAAMTPHLMEIIRKYHLAPRIGYFTGDNDAKNDTCLRQLAVGLSQEYGLTFDPVSSRTRCAGHIINLSLQAFLFATSEDALQAAIEQAQDEANDVTVSDALHDRIQSNTCQKSHGRRNKRNDTAGWRSIGPMDNIAVFIRNSTVRNDAWDDIAGKALGIDNITRWNSWFKLLDAAISQEGPLSIFLNQYHEELEDDILTHDDWQVLKMTHEFLQPFYQATLEQQMEWASIDQVLENMDILFLQFENAKVSHGRAVRSITRLVVILKQVKYVNNARMVNSVHMGWWVLSKYYEESDKNPIYATALLLHPEKRRRYLDRHWAEEWRQTAIAGARRHWAKYKDRPLSSDSAARLSNERREVTPYERIKQSMSVLDEPGDEDEFEKFVNSPPRHMTTNTPLEWWCREEQRIEYPRLHQMAIDILSVPAMSDDPERVFSCARRTISWDRARLSTDTIEKLQCLSNWVKNDLIRKLYVAIDDEIMVVAGDDDDIPDPSLL
ncbi:hypothetical protein FOFC_16121 [Fusarium oxysporum]|nr:hypothetical protein FOFC_16121 [Fusarium oxysporum]